MKSACGHRLDAILPADVEVSGHAIQARVYAEDPIRFLPPPGRSTCSALRAETASASTPGYAEGGRITPYYDPLVAKVIVHADERNGAIGKLHDALDEFAIEGIKTNIPFIQAALGNESFVSGDVHTGLAEEVVASLKA